MYSAKFTFIGGAAGLMALQSAAAADLPARKAAPVDYVRVCDWTGVGYFYVPGTDVCMQIGGIVRVEGAFINNSRQFYPTATVGQSTRLAAHGTTIIGRDEDESGLFVRARIQVDTRTQTAYGTLRTYIRYQFDRSQGLYALNGSVGAATSYANAGSNSANINRAFIQFAGITAGRVQSLFDFYADYYNYENFSSSDQFLPVFAYTYNVTKEFTATLSVESHEARSDGIGTIQGGRFEVGGVNQGATALAARYGGTGIPDVVGVLRYDAGWGSAQLSGAYHQVNTNAGPYAGTTQGFQHDDADGFAVMAGLRVKLPMLAAGDEAWFQAGYQNGAYLYEDSVPYTNAGLNSRLVGGFQHVDHDAIAIGLPGSTNGAYILALSRGFSISAVINHYFSARFHDVAYASYQQTSYGSARNIDWTLGGLGDASKLRLGNQFLFDPAKNLEIGLEFDYGHVNQSLAHNIGQVATALPAGVAKDDDAFEFRLRVERDF